MLNEDTLATISQPGELLKGQRELASTPVGEALLRGDYAAALKLLDERLVTAPNSLIDRLWWVRCQYELGSLPVTALSSPLEEMFPQLMRDASIAELAVATFTKVGLRLREKSYSKLGAVICEKAVELAQRAENLAPEFLRVSVQAYRYLLTEELERATKRGEPKAYLAAIQKKIDSIPSIPESGQGSRTTPKPPDTAPAAEIAEDNWQIGDAAAILTNRSNSTSSSKARTEAKPPVTGEGVSKPAPARASNLTFSMVLLVATVVALWFFLFREPTNEELAQRMAMQPFGGEMTFILPELSVRSPAEIGGVEMASTDGSGGLDSLSSRLQKLGEPGREADNAPPTEQSTGQSIVQSATSPNVSSTAVATTSAPESAPKPLPPPTSLDPRKAPLINPDTLKNTTVENLGGDPRASVAPRADQGLERGRDGQLYGPPLSIDNRRDSNAGGSGSTSARDPYERPGRALDGGPIRSFPVDRFTTPLTFKTITATNVLEAPSVLAPAIDRLMSDAVIKVISRMGKWLEIESRGGRRGFIYAQDAIEVTGSASK